MVQGLQLLEKKKKKESYLDLAWIPKLQPRSELKSLYHGIAARYEESKGLAAGGSAELPSGLGWGGQLSVRLLRQFIQESVEEVKHRHLKRQAELRGVMQMPYSSLRFAKDAAVSAAIKKSKEEEDRIRKAQEELEEAERNRLPKPKHEGSELSASMLVSQAQTRYLHTCDQQRLRPRMARSRGERPQAERSCGR